MISWASVRRNDLSGRPFSMVDLTETRAVPVPGTAIKENDSWAKGSTMQGNKQYNIAPYRIFSTTGRSTRVRLHVHTITVRSPITVVLCSYRSWHLTCLCVLVLVNVNILYPWVFLRAGHRCSRSRNVEFYNFNHCSAPHASRKWWELTTIRTQASRRKKNWIRTQSLTKQRT